MAAKGKGKYNPETYCKETLDWVVDMVIGRPSVFLPDDEYCEQIVEMGYIRDQRFYTFTPDIWEDVDGKVRHFIDVFDGEEYFPLLKVDTKRDLIEIFKNFIISSHITIYKNDWDENGLFKVAKGERPRDDPRVAQMIYVRPFIQPDELTVNLV